jgi:hypothetical protein
MVKIPIPHFSCREFRKIYLFLVSQFDTERVNSLFEKYGEMAFIYGYTEFCKAYMPHEIGDNYQKFEEHVIYAQFIMVCISNNVVAMEALWNNSKICTSMFMNGNTAIQNAIKFNAYDAVRFLLSQKCDLMTHDGETTQDILENPEVSQRIRDLFVGRF